MSKLIFVNLPVADLKRSVAFYEGIGATKNPQFSDDTAACMVISETIHVMILTHDKFSQFTALPIADARKSCQVLLCLSENSRDEVDRSVDRAVQSGGSADPGPVQEHGFMYGRSFCDPDGHIWELAYVDMPTVQEMNANP